MLWPRRGWVLGPGASWRRRLALISCSSYPCVSPLGLDGCRYELVLKGLCLSMDSEKEGFRVLREVEFVGWRTWKLGTLTGGSDSSRVWLDSFEPHGFNQLTNIGFC